MSATLSFAPHVNRSAGPEDSAAVRAGGSIGVAPLADLIDTGCDLTFTRPSEHDSCGPCEDCTRIHRVAIAVVSWPDPHETNGRDEIAVCRDCLPRQLAAADARCHPEQRISVEAPAWTLDDLAIHLGVPTWEITRWGLLVAETDGTSGNRYLADEVDHARRMLALGVGGVSLVAADKLLRRDPDVAASVEKVLVAA